MRKYVLLLAGIGLINASVAAAPLAGQTAGAKPPAQTAKPAAEGAKPNADKKEIKLTEKVLKTYEGEYEMGPTSTLVIKAEKGYLWGTPTNQPTRQMFPESQTKFFLKDLDVQVTFQKDAKGAVTGMQMTQKGQTRDLKKLK